MPGSLVHLIGRLAEQLGCVRVPLVGRQLVQPNRLLGVLGDTLTLGVAHPEVELRLLVLTKQD